MRRLLFIAALCLITLPCWAATVVVRSGIHDRYNRLVFDWTAPVKYTMQQQGGWVQIQFDRDATADFKQALATNLPFVRNLAQKSSDKGLLVTFQIPDQSRVQGFPVGTKLAFDILRLNNEPAKFSDAAAPLVPPPAPAPVPAQKAEIPTPQPVSAAPAAEETVTSGPQKPENLNKSGFKTLAEVLEEKPPENKLQEPAKAEAPITKGTVIRLQPQQMTRLAVFERSGRLWVVIDQAIPNLLPRVEGQQTSAFQNLRRIDGDKATAFVFDAPTGDVVYSLKRQDNEWQIWLNPADKPYLPTQMPITATEDTISLYAGEQPRVVALKDSRLGDTLWVVPVRTPEGRVLQARRSLGYELPTTLMGAVIIPRSDILRVTTANDLVLLSSSTGPKTLVSSPNDRQTGSIDPKMPSLFRLYKMKDKFEKERQKIEDEMVKAKTPAEKAKKNIELARLYVANGFGHEALGLLRIAVQLVPVLDTDPDYRALYGMAGALAENLEQAEPYLTTPEIQSHPLAKLWLGYAYAQNNQWISARAAFIESSNSENNLPEMLRPRMLIAKAESALQAGDVVSAQDLTKKLEEIKNLRPNEKAAQDYLRAKILAAAGKGEKSIDLFQKLQDSPDSLYRIKSDLNMIEQQLAAKQIDRPKAIEQLERLRFSWRGDRIEVEILDRLANYYVDEKKYMEGLTLWRRAASLSRDSEDTDAMTRNMQELFRKLYVDGLSDPLEPLRAVAIFQGFKELTPPGEEGNIAIQRLADRLISVDLLDQADGLLQNQLMLHAEGESALAIGTKLASLRIKNNNPEGALKALDESNRDDITDMDIERKRLLLRAHALADTNKVDEALALLKDIQTPEALSLKADINWKQSRWPDAIVALQGLVGYYRDHAKTEVDGPIGPLVLRMAVALSLDNNEKGIELLVAGYGGFMAKTKLANQFTVVTKPSRGSSLADIETLKNQVGEVQLFEDFLKGL